MKEKKDLLSPLHLMIAIREARLSLPVLKKNRKKESMENNSTRLHTYD